MGTPDEGRLPDPGLELANGARVYDYLLGGAHNIGVDREHAERLLAANPGQRCAAHANRAFLGRAVRWCLARGIDQFLDLGSGVPTVGNVHEIAHQRQPDARVAYVDIDPVAVALSTEITSGLETVTITQADLRDPATVLSAASVAGLLDFKRPVALLAVACLHFVTGDAAGILHQYRERLATASALVISHGSDDLDDPEHAARKRAAAETFAATASPLTYRSRRELRELIGDFELVEPGLVDVTDWPTAAADRESAATWALVAIKRGMA